MWLSSIRNTISPPVFGLCLTLTELPVLGDHLAVAAEALTGVGSIAVYTVALPSTWVLVTLIHIYNRRQGRQADDGGGEIAA